MELPGPTTAATVKSITAAQMSNPGGQKPNILGILGFWKGAVYQGITDKELPFKIDIDYTWTANRSNRNSLPEKAES